MARLNKIIKFCGVYNSQIECIEPNSFPEYTSIVSMGTEKTTDTIEKIHMFIVVRAAAQFIIKDGATNDILKNIT